MDAATTELLVYRILVTKYWVAVAVMIFVYDYFLTFEREVRLVWKSSWGIGKVLFLLTRYSALIEAPLAVWLYFLPNVPLQTCLPIFLSVYWMSVFGLATAETLLFLRTSALYNNATKVSLTLLSILVSTQITVIVVVSLYLRSVEFHPAPPPFSGGCYPSPKSRIIYGAFIVLLLQETTVFLFTVVRAVQTGIKTRNRLLQTLYRDGGLYYLYLIVISVGNIVLLTKGPLASSEVLQPFLRVMHAVLSTRVLLNARGAVRHREVTVTDFQSVFTSFVRGTISVDGVDCEQQIAISFDGR